MARYTIHKHTTTTKAGKKYIHYDFRFEYRGIVKSFFTKRTSDGKSNKFVCGFGKKRPMVFDGGPHSKASLTFEGDIEAGEYGGGEKGGVLKITNTGKCDVKKSKGVYKIHILTDDKGSLEDCEFSFVPASKVYKSAEKGSYLTSSKKYEKEEKEKKGSIFGRILTARIKILTGE